MYKCLNTIFGRPFVKRFALWYWSVVCLSVPYCLSVCLSVAFVHCGQTVGRIKMKLRTHVGLSPGHIVLNLDPALPPPKGHSPHPIFGPYLLRPNGCMVKMPLGMELGLSPGGFVLDGDPALPSPKRAEPPNFRPISIVVKWMHVSRCHLV